ncbi:hypothetical protein DFR28_1021064 [Arenicella xantha]|uniref:Uncharacterized protein n=2 Tax=Arenicella xantha TaxID=644221 RepID=A0A395JLJ5_9GAMM|nr:hypothetical protein DFR28_1021064 [Arenicella xantha]
MIVERVGMIADSIVRKITWFVVLGVFATLYLAWNLYSAESALWWNVLKCGVIALPALLWAFVWLVLSQLRDAPSQVAGLMDADNELMLNLKSVTVGESRGLRGLFSTLNALRKEDGLSAIFDTIGGVTLLANPFFALLALVMMAVLGLLILIAITLLVF